MNWIKIKTTEDLPNFYQEVFIYTEKGFKTIAFATEKNGEFLGFVEDSKDDYYIKDVEYWLPVIFPNNPKE